MGLELLARDPILYTYTGPELCHQIKSFGDQFQ